ncbi:MAG: PDZ domain-containing protein [Cyanobacteria bacterium]|nr:PDZ domain-containing protein [Cyanobacteria bacterium CG_2015-16_32_12]NCO79536.1 PDZ domain-containing protein [Cyanobacteria bacterium CG_2015-22_32_23]NCQ03348.1 PDZ domain-containing protein [Cyanobacteria bacterium CG_2015-09_32_10]NCQ43008.1 PDZ domain-containing protein [Cyanobacteria bacterium CG_2015-04_32_10]NCS84920.1 PDZ domain-containing protein [Cyanobacteria bacterium CG_2015-02_32_10]
MRITKRGLVLSTTALAISSVAITGFGLRFSQSQAFFQDSPKEIIDEVWQVVNRNYVDGTFNGEDWREVRTEYLDKQYKDKEEAYTAIREMLKKLNDPYTRFMNPEEFKSMQIDTSGELTGIGIQISKDEKTQEIVVISPIEDTPAFKAGIVSKDIIREIDGKSTKGMELNDAVSLIRGKPNTSVTILIERGGKTLNFNITRATIEIHPVKARIDTDSKLGKVDYVRLVQFSGNAAAEMKQAIIQGEKDNVAGYILDLRSNPGGLLYSSVEIARMFIDEGKIVTTVDRVGEVDAHTANKTALTKKPVVVLVDGGSASASEILSGALQDHKRATIVGTQTFGKGLVQSVRGLGDGSGMAVTIAKYLTPDGRDINKHGITPDVVYELTDADKEVLIKDREKVGTIEDAQFKKAIEILTQQVAKK